MTESDPFHVFDGSAENVISISSYIETVGSFSNRPLSKGLYRPSDNDGVLTCVDSLFICGLCWNPPQNQLNFGKFLVPSIGCSYILELLKPVRTPVAILGSLGVCIYVPASRHWLISYSLIQLN